MLKPIVVFPVLFGVLFAFFLAVGLPYWAMLVLAIGLVVAGFELYMTRKYNVTLSDRFLFRYRRSRLVGYTFVAILSAFVTYLVLHLFGHY